LGQPKNNYTMNKEEKIFADGFSFKRNENAPDFVVGRLSMKVDEAIAFMKEHEKRGWINLNVKTARSGNHYIELDTYEPKGSAEAESAPAPKAKAKKTSHHGDEGLPF
jgi:hypothetical protein